MSNVMQEYEFIVGYLERDFRSGAKKYARKARIDNRETFDVVGYERSVDDFFDENEERLLDTDLQSTKVNYPDIYKGIAFWLKGITDGVFNAGWDGLPDYDNLTTLRAYADQVSKISDVHKHHI